MLGPVPAIFSALVVVALVAALLVARARRSRPPRPAAAPLRRHLRPTPVHREVNAGDPVARAQRDQPDPRRQGWLVLGGEARATEWIRSGFPHPEAAELWDAEGFAPEEAGAWRPVAAPRVARAWVAAGFDRDEAAAWIAAGCDDPAVAAQQRHDGVEPSQLRAGRGRPPAVEPGASEARRRGPDRLG
jgi:hypothetical protein